jgi:beta-galactosidase
MIQYPSKIIRLLLFLLVSAGAGFDGACASVVASASPRTVTDLDEDWRFSKGDFGTAMVSAFDDSAWRAVNLPHDWSSEGPFSAEYGSGNGYAPGGVGWYRRHFKLDLADTNKLVTVEFDGVYDLCLDKMPICG